MTTILIWLGSGVAFSVGVCCGAFMMRWAMRKPAMNECERRSIELLEERNMIAEQQEDQIRRIANILENR